MEAAKRKNDNTALSVGIILAACFLCMMPFFTKAYHMDDYLFLAAARTIQAHPLDFYGFPVNWYGMYMPLSEIMKNPPLSSYYIAAVTFFFGWKETTLHLAYLVPMMAAAVGIFYLGKQTCTQPLLATFAALSTPVFFVSATNVMCDVLMLAFYIWAIYFWHKGLKNDHMAYLAVSSLLIALSGLTKYFGITLLPLLIVYSIYEKKSIGKWMLFFLIPVSILAAYNIGTQSLYGRGLLMDAAAYAYQFQGISAEHFKQSLITLVFMGGCLLPYLFFCPFLWPWYVCILSILFTGCMLSMPFFLYSSSISLTSRLLIILLHMTLFIVTSASVMAATMADVVKTKSSEAVLLFLWIWGTFLFTAFFNWTINGRSLLPMAPAASIVLARVLEQRGGINCWFKRPWQWAMPLIPAVMICFLIAQADKTLADTGRKVAETIKLDLKDHKGTLWFQGHWGFQYYMESIGGRPFDHDLTLLKAGDFVVIPGLSTNKFPLPESCARLRYIYTFQPFGFAATMNPKLGAGFYMNFCGTLPFTFGKVPDERYALYEIISQFR